MKKLYSNDIIQKIACSALPLVWGGFVCFMGWGPGSTVISSHWLNFVIQAVSAALLITYAFGSALQNASKKYHTTFFGYSFPLPSWRFFILLPVIAACCSSVPLFQGDFMSSLIRGVMVSSIIEEFITRSFFITYRMGLREFILFNTLSSLAFTFMHGFYIQGGVDMYELLQRGHFAFSFMLGVIVYKTQRIELAIILHMLSNLLRYTIPVCLLLSPWPSSVALLLSMVVDGIWILCLGGCSYLKPKNSEPL
jgi:membrane protease YdiL (CAAX protease family)